MDTRNEISPSLSGTSIALTFKALGICKDTSRHNCISYLDELWFVSKHSPRTEAFYRRVSVPAFV